MPFGHLTVRAPLLALALAVAACTSQAGPTELELDTTSVRIGALHDQMAAVAEVQQAAEPALAEALALTHDIDSVVAGFRSPSTIDQTRERFAAVASRARALDVESLQPPIRAIAFAVDDARAALARARDALPDPTDRAYLDAEDEVLQAVRRYAEAADALAQVIASAWPAYTDAVTRTQAFLDGPEVYRTDDEASDAYEVRIHDVLDELRRASERIADFQERRAAAARDLNAASAVASERWRQRTPVAPAPSMAP